MERGGAAAVILNAKGEVLLVHHTYGKCNWELPGGGGERGESPAETAVREVREEAGIDVIPLRITGWYYDPATDQLHAAVLCEAIRPDQAPQPDGTEVSECQFWPPDDLPRPYSDFTELRIADALAPNPQPLPAIIGDRIWRL